jgi:hypothetical protein
MKNRLGEIISIASGVVLLGIGVVKPSTNMLVAAAPALVGGAISLKTKSELEKKIKGQSRSIETGNYIQTEVEQLKNSLASTKGELKQALSQVRLLEDNLKNANNNQSEQIQLLSNDLKAAQQEKENLSTKVQQLKDKLRDAWRREIKLSKEFKQKPVLQAQLRTVKKYTVKILVKKTKNYSELILDRSKSRQKLIEALKTADKELIMVCPWVSHNAIDHSILELIESALKKGVTISIGYGNLDDLKKVGGSIDNLLKTINGTGLYVGRLTGLDWKYTALKSLKEKAEKYPGQLDLRILGTHEKYLICDNKFCIIGSHNFLTSGDSSNEKEIGVLLTEQKMIQRTRDRFLQSK